MTRNHISLIESLFFFCFFFTLPYIFVLLKCHGDIELYPGPENFNKKNFLSICHWNFNSLTAHDFSKLTQLKVCNSAYRHDFICPSGTCFDSTTPVSLLEIGEYKLVLADHLNNIRKRWSLRLLQRVTSCSSYKLALPKSNIIIRSDV